MSKRRRRRLAGQYGGSDSAVLNVGEGVCVSMRVLLTKIFCKYSSVQG